MADAPLQRAEESGDGDSGDGDGDSGDGDSGDGDGDSGDGASLNLDPSQSIAL